MAQRTLFDDEFEADLASKRHARRTDPDTSRQAAREVQYGRLQAEALELVKRHPGHTAKELCQIAGWDVWKRISELAEANLIRNVGQRRCMVSNRNARTWEVV